MESDLHYPPGAEPEPKPAEVSPAETPAETPKEEPKGDKPAEPTPEGEEPNPEKEDAKGEQPETPEPTKKRSIYDDYKEKKQEAKDATARAEAAEARAAELQALLETKDEAKTPKEKSEAKDAIDEWADKQGLDGKAVRELTDIIKGSLPKPEGGVLTPEEAAEWRAERARAKAAAEDQAILSEGSKVKEQLAISDETELQAVMQEIVRLAHTKAFHDKEVDYIVWKNRDALAKMVSPKKSSFEEGGQRSETADTGPKAFSGKMTPMQAEQAFHSKEQ